MQENYSDLEDRTPSGTNSGILHQQEQNEKRKRLKLQHAVLGQIQCQAEYQKNSLDRKNELEYSLRGSIGQ